jgi:hypothetical protein
MTEPAGDASERASQDDAATRGIVLPHRRRRADREKDRQALPVLEALRIERGEG